MGMSSRDRQAWALLLPLLVIIVTVTGYPLISTIRLSFTDASLTGRHVAQHWVGFENYAYVFTDPDFGDAFRRTLYFTFVSVGIEILLGVLVALLLNREFAGRTIVRAIMVLPWALPTIVNAMMWRLIYNPEFGSLNALLSQLGLIDSYRSWLGTPGTAMNMVILADVWKNYPLVAIIVLAALQTIPRELYEAADIDGAGPWTEILEGHVSRHLGPAQRGPHPAHDRGLQGLRHHLSHDPGRAGRYDQIGQLLRLSGILRLSARGKRGLLCRDRGADQRGDDRDLHHAAAPPGVYSVKVGA